jgi:flagellar motor protein MotB
MIRSTFRSQKTRVLLIASTFMLGAIGLTLPSGSTLARAQSSDDKQSKTPLPLKPEVPGVQVNHRLILKDGSYQIVRKYEVVGSRVRYISVERGGDWEELPYDLVDWTATKKWEQQQADRAANAQSPAMQEAAEIDREEAAEREAQKDRMPEVAPGLNLPNQDGVFVLDEFQGTPELVELVPSTGDLQMARQHGLRSVLPLQSQMAQVELEGPAAKVHLHVNEPVLYLSLDDREDGREIADQVTGHAITVDTQGASQVQHPKKGAASPTSGFAIVHVDERKAVRIVGTVHVSPTGEITQQENVIPMVAEVLPGKHWLKLKPKEPLKIGEYALIEILSAKDMNASVWDFQVNPSAGHNESSIGPIDTH